MSNSAISLQQYTRVTRTGTYSFLAVLPMLFGYEILINLVNVNASYQVRVGADIWIKELLSQIGGVEQLSLGIMTLIVGAIICISERRQSIPIRISYFTGMIIESFAYSIIVAILISNLVAKLFSLPMTGMIAATPLLMTDYANEFWLKIALSLGAGIYEELLFRVVLVSSLFVIIHVLFSAKERTCYIGAAIGAALLFSAVHYLGPLGDVFAWRTFIFRFLFGLALNALYLLRGFGIAAWSHALYDIMVVVMFDK